MSLTLYFLRHGQTTYSEANMFCGSGIDADLKREGYEMAHAVARAYDKMQWRAIYCSPLKRARMTAQPLCDVVNMPMQLRDELMEIGYGAWEGKTADEVDRIYHDDYIRWQADPAWNPPTDGEPAIEIARRSLKVIEEIKEKYSDGNVLIVSHKATIRIILCGFLGIDVGRFRYRLSCPVSSMSVVEFTKSGPSLKLLADRSHLSEDLRNLPGA
jgi:broad specificity phosphatase PhoE